MSKELKTLKEYESLSRGLKALDEFRLLINNYEDKWDERTTSFFRNCHDTIEKELKSFEIIKPYLKEIIGMNVYDRDFYECFIQIGNKRVFITKEKYDLLKEVLQ